MRKSVYLHTSRRIARRTAEPGRADGRHAPGARTRIARRRTCGIDAQPAILLDLTDQPAVLGPEIEASERHPATLVDDLLD